MKSDNSGSAESIFAGKRKFHKAMANLPIEEKVKMVASLQRIDYSIKPAAWKKRMMWGCYGEFGDTIPISGYRVGK
ncbi:MAG: hypothetical protein Q7R35_03865 [Elusimicrobiota bacterium]|nr:hypothetical protein [Elusimicrobiota bacterium]